METSAPLGASQGLAKLQVADEADKGSGDRISVVLALQRQFQDQLQLSQALSARLDVMAKQAVGLQAVIVAALTKLRTSKPAREGMALSKRKNTQTAGQVRTAACSSPLQMPMGSASGPPLAEPINHPLPRSDGLASCFIESAAALHGLQLLPSASPVANTPYWLVDELRPSSDSFSLPASSSPRRLLSSATPEIAPPASATSSQHDRYPAGSPAPTSPPDTDFTGSTGKRARAEVDAQLKLPSLSQNAADSYSPYSQEDEYSAGFMACANQHGRATKRLRVPNDRNPLGAQATAKQPRQQPEGKLKNKSKDGQQQKQQKAMARFQYGTQQGRNVGLQESAEASQVAPTALHCPLVFKPSYFSNPYVIQQLQHRSSLREAETSTGTAAAPNTTPMVSAICPNDQLAQSMHAAAAAAAAATAARQLGHQQGLGASEGFGGTRNPDEQAGQFAWRRPSPDTRGGFQGSSCTLNPAYPLSAYNGQWQLQPACGPLQAHTGRLQPVCLDGSGRIVVTSAAEGPRPWPQGAVTQAAFASSPPALPGYTVAQARPLQSIYMAPQQRLSGYDATCYVGQLPSSCLVDDDVEAAAAVQGLGLL